MSDGINELNPTSQEGVNINRIQLVLAEKRTALAVMRTGIAVFTLPLSVLTLLIATSGSYDALETYHLIIPLLIICTGLIVLAIYLVHRSMIRIWRQEKVIEKIKQDDPELYKLYERHLYSIGKKKKD